MVAPVAELRPGIPRLGNFPIDSAAAYPVRVEAVHRHRVDEDRDDVRRVFGIRPEKRLPVLENVAPVPLVVYLVGAVERAHVYVELVPRTARVAVPARERQREVLEEKPRHLRVFLRLNHRLELVSRYFRCRGKPRVRKHPAHLPSERDVPLLREVDEIRDGNPSAVGEDSPAHDVEHDVRPVVKVGNRVPRALDSVGRCNLRGKARVSLADVVLKDFPRLSPVPDFRLKLRQTRAVVSDVENLLPAFGAAPGKRAPVDDVAFAALSVQLAFLREEEVGLVLHEKLHGAVGDDDRVVRREPADVRRERLARLGHVRDRRGEREERDVSVRVDLALPVRVEQDAPLVLQSRRAGRRHNVAASVED